MKSSSSNKLKKLFADTDRKKKKPDSLLKKSARAYLMHLLQSPQEQPSRIAGSILNANFDFESLNFKDVQDMIGRSLTDDDIHRLLLAVDGVNKINSLKLTHCFGVTGAGLAPLRGSTVLERIDLSLVGDYESPIIDGDTSISVYHVVPTLNSILDTDGNSLVHIQFPRQWSIEDEENDLLTAFLEVYNNVLVSRQNPCLAGDHECERVCGGKLVSAKGQTSCCNICLKYVCDECEEKYKFVECCELCEKPYCCECTSLLHCDECHKRVCGGCGGRCAKCQAMYYCSSCEPLRFCDHCEERHCLECSVKCDDCDKVNCEACNDEHEERIEACGFQCDGGCGDDEGDVWSRCFDCRVRHVEEKEVSSCPGCAQKIAPTLAKMVKRLRREVREG